MLDILCGFSVGPSCFAFWELPSALTSHCSIRFLYFSYAFHFQELSPVLCPLPCLLLPDNGYCRFLLFSVLPLCSFFSRSCWCLSLMFPLVTGTGSPWLSKSDQFTCAIVGFARERSGGISFFGRASRCCYLPGSVLLTCLPFFFFLGWSFSPEKNPLVTSCCLKRKGQCCACWVGKRPDGLTLHLGPCFEHSSSYTHMLLCLLYQAWGSSQVVSVKHITPAPARWWRSGHSTPWGVHKLPSLVLFQASLVLFCFWLSSLLCSPCP